MSVTTFVTDRALAGELQVSLWFVQEQCRQHRWPHLKVGGRYRFTTTHVEQIANLLEVAPAEAASPVEPHADIVDASWNRSTRSSAQRARAARSRSERNTA